MNILTLCYEFPPLGGGGGKVVQGLSKDIVKLGYQIDIITMGYKGLSNYEEHGGANIYRVPCLRASEAICHSHEMASYIAFTIPKLKKLVANKRYDLNHTHFIFPDGIIAYLLKKRFGLPYVITAHGSDVPGYNPDRFKMQHKIIAPLWKTIVQNSACIICPSRTIESLIHLQKPDATTSVIPNGMDINRLKPPQEKQKSILVVTRMFKRKGVQYCIEALKGFKHGFEVNIVGDGPYLDTLRDMAKTNGLNIKFWGWLDNDSSQLKDLFEKSSIFIFPSEAENFPIVLLEAMAAGMAIITTQGTGCSEVVGDSALLVEPRDSNGIRNALSSLVNDPNFCRSLGVSSRKRLENNFSWISIAKRYSDLFQKYITA